ncbi:MAG: hypothetical protein IPL87_03940 [Candidatus Moraniibacteriota bacterium]|nr:MAG: hypothetical protein IPL87_03940 [Candidatus Moranbacteria bacterium]
MERFLETAVVNRLDLSASVLIDIQAIAEYARPAAPKRPLASPSSVPNAWSLTAFEFSKQTGMSVEAGLEAREEAEREKERIDEKTGHIYITGDSIEEPRREEWERVRLISEEWKERLGAIFRRGMRSMREYVATRKKRREERLSLPSPQEVTSEAVQIHTRETSPKEATMHPSETFPTEKSEKIFPPLEEESLESESAPERDVVEKRAEVSIDSAILPPEHSANNTISFLKYFAKPFFGALVSNLSKHSRTVAHSVPRFFSRKTVHVPVREETPSTLSSLFRPLFFFFPRLEKEAKRAWNFWNLLSPTKRRLLQGIMLLTLFAIIGFVIFLLTKDAPPLPEEPSSLKENPASPSPLTTEKNIRFLKNPTTLFEGERILSIVRLKEFRLVITETALFRLGEPGSTAEKVPYPEGREAKKGVAMLDLNALILLMKDGTIRFYTPVNNRFANESFSLPNSSGTAALGAYMTYLYVANFEQNSITRLPRSEGGFASGVSWLKEPVEIDEQTSLALGEFLYLAHPSDIRVYSRGTLQNISFEKPALVPDITALSLPDLESTSLFALDQKEGRIFEYRKDTGAILAQYAHESLKGGKNFTVDTKNRNALVNTETHVFSFSLDEHSLLSH